MTMPIKRFGLYTLAFLLVLGLTQGPALLTRGMVNRSLKALVTATSCDPNWFVCQVAPFRSLSPPSFGNLNELDRASRLLETAERYAPSPVTRLHLATAHFLSGDRQSAALALSQFNGYPSGRSPLVSEGRYEYYLVEARAHILQESWSSAIENFYKAMVLEPNRILPVDDRELYIALAGWQRAVATPWDTQAKLFAGKFLVQARSWTEGLDLIQKALSDDSANQLSVTERAVAKAYQARALRATGNLAGAQAALRQAVILSPKFRQPYIDLLDILQKTESGTKADNVELQLEALGPTFRLGQFGLNYALDEPTVLPSGWKLIGYEVDEQLLEWATAVDLVLWWQAPTTAPPGEDFLRVGSYWLQNQTVRNLFPNSGFEWGMDEQGLPLGHDREYYSAPEGSLGVETDKRNGASTQVLWAQNSPQVQHVALISASFAVDPNAYYLTAGWLRDEDQLARIGRLCVEKLLAPDLIYYVASPAGGRPTGHWLHVANLAPAIPGESPIACETFISNNNSRGKSSWDNVLLARLPIP